MIYSRLVTRADGWRKATILVLGVALLLAACSGGGSPAAHTTVPTAPTVITDPYAIPATIDPALADQWVGLKPLPAGRDPRHQNPTPWIFVYDGFPRDHSQPANPCAKP